MDFVDTADLDEAAEVFGRTFPGIDICREDEGRPFRFQYCRATRGAWSRTVLDIRGEVGTPGMFPEHFAVGRRRRGQVSIAYEGIQLDTTRAYLRPRGVSMAQFQDAQVELLIVERSAFAARAQRLLEGSGRTLREPRPGDTAPLSPAQGRLWDATVDALAPLFSTGSPAMEAVLDELATAALLSAFPLTSERSKPHGSSPTPPASAYGPCKTASADISARPRSHTCETPGFTPCAAPCKKPNPAKAPSPTSPGGSASPIRRGSPEIT